MNYVPRSATVLILSDDEVRPASLADALRESELARFEPTVEPGLDPALQSIPYTDLVVVDAALQDPEPELIVGHLAEVAPHIPVAWLLDPDEDETMQPDLIGTLDDIVVWPDDGSIPADHVLLQALQRHRMLARLNERKAEVLTLVHGITHDLRGPLASLDYLLEMARESAEATATDAAELLDHLNRSRGVVDNMMSMVDEILRIAEVSGRRPKDQPLDLCALADQVADELGNLAKRNGVRLDLDLEPCLIMGDRNRLFHLLYNLVHNAIKHSPAGEAVQIHARRADASDEGSPLRLRVTDAGPGVPNNVPPLATVQQYLEMHPPRPGHGMGLQMALLAASHHNSEIRIENEPTGGVSFVLDLPGGRVLPMD